MVRHLQVSPSRRPSRQTLWTTSTSLHVPQKITHTYPFVIQINVQLKTRTPFVLHQSTSTCFHSNLKRNHREEICESRPTHQQNTQSQLFLRTNSLTVLRAQRFGPYLKGSKNERHFKYSLNETSNHTKIYNRQPSIVNTQGSTKPT